MPQPVDLLAPYRAPGAKTPRVSLRPQPAGYRAVGVVSLSARPSRLDIRKKDGMSIARAYSTITEIAYDRDAFTGVLLVAPGKVIKIRGRNLGPVVEALLAGAAEFVAELRDGENAPDGEPAIDRIEILAAQASTASTS